MCISEDNDSLSHHSSDYSMKCTTLRKQLTYDSHSRTNDDSQAIPIESHLCHTDNGNNGNGLKWLAMDINVRRSPRGHTSSKCPQYDPYTGKPLEPTGAPAPTKEAEDSHTRSGRVVLDTDLANLVAPNSG